MTMVHRDHTCPWCESNEWQLKTLHNEEEPRLKCSNCNAGFRVENLPEALDSDRRKEVDA